MSVKQFLVCVAMIFATVSWARANLGEDSDRIESTYGNLVHRHLRDDGTVTMLYHKDRYLCLVLFDRRRSIFEMYCRMDGRSLSNREISRFLKANGGRATWTRDDTSTEKRFERSDHKAGASYENVDGRPTLKVRELPTRKAGGTEPEPGDSWSGERTR
jgi:hypothetical protein